MPDEIVDASSLATEAFDFSSLDKAGEEALKYLQSGGKAPDAPITDAIAQPVAQEVKPPVSATGLPDDMPVTLKVDGKDVTRSVAEWKKGWMQETDYTQGKQQISHARSYLDGLIRKVEERESLAEKLLSDPRVMGAIKALEAQAQVKPNPGDLVTYEQVEQTKEEIRNFAREEIARATNDIATSQFENEVLSTTQSTLKALAQEHPELGKPDQDVLIRRRALADKPRNVEELKAALIKAGKGLVAEREADIAERLKQAVANSDKLSKGVEPPGGAAPAMPTKAYFDKKSGKVDWDQLETDALAFARARK